jgi:putative aldouronate transport system permease protein
MKIKKKKISLGTILLHLFFVLFSLGFILPFIYVISVSFSSEASILQFGYSLIPKEFDTTAYKYVFSNSNQIVDSYIVTAFIAVVGTIMSLIVMSLVAYPLSRRSFKYKKILIFYVFFTMLFSGGLIPSYIFNTQLYGLNNNIWVYILPSLATAFYILIIKTFFQDLPPSLIEAAKIDGASEFRILFQIVLPLSKPVLATVALFCVLGKWNDWFTSLIYIKNPHLYTLQFLLQRILRESEFVKSMIRDMPGGVGTMDINKTLPSESMKFAMCIISAGPMIAVFPFFQKYFTKGLTVGAVKG